MSLTSKDKKDIRSVRRMKVLNGMMLLALVIGVGGNLYAGEGISDSLFSTLMMFAVNYTDQPQNIAINIARFMAAFFTLSAILAIVESSFMIIGDRIRGRRRDSLFVYGDSQASEEIMKSQKNVIDGKNGFVNASSYVLMGDEDENLQFYTEHRDRLLGKRVYLKTETLPGVLVGDEHLRSFCLEELAGQEFWRKYSLIDQAYDEGGSPASLKVSIIGFGKLAEEILFYGLQEMALSEVEWHLFGDTHRFEQLHQNLDLLNVCCYEEEWYDHLDVLRASDRIIVAGQENQLRTISDLFLVSADWKIYVCTAFSDEGEHAREIFLRHRAGSVPEENLVLFDWRQEGMRLEQIRRQETIKSEDKDSFQTIVHREWAAADTFKRYSYLNLLEFREQRRSLTERWGSERIDEDELERILHKRICFYYWFHNWDFSAMPDPANPAARENATLRLSRNLCAFEDRTPDQIRWEKRIVELIL